MIVGILKEIKAEENRVCMTPSGVEVMKANGHTILVEKAAGGQSGCFSPAPPVRRYDATGPDSPTRPGGLPL